MGLEVKNPLTKAGDMRDEGLIPGWEDPLEKQVATHSSFLTKRIPGTEEPGGLWSIGLQSVRYNQSKLACTVDSEVNP